MDDCLIWMCWIFIAWMVQELLAETLCCEVPVIIIDTFAHIGSTKHPIKIQRVRL